MLLAQPRMRLSVEAHTDAKGEPNENARLSLARAAAVSQARIEPSGRTDARTHARMDGRTDNRPC